jgi:hypothetical protein
MKASQYIMIAVLLFLLAAPIPTILLLGKRPVTGTFLTWMANRTLTGITIPRQDVAISMKAWLDGSFQQSAQQWANENFAGRELAIRWFNQILWSLFGKSYMNLEHPIAGGEGQLFASQYLEHFGRLSAPRSDGALNRATADITRLRTRLQKYDVPLVVLFTPSKPLSVPEDVPARYIPKQTPASIPYERDRLKMRLLAAGIPVVDGAELTRGLGDRLPLSPFPKTGIHWTDLAASYSAEALLRKFEILGGRPLARLEVSDVQFAESPRDSDSDVLELLNLALPRFDHYAYGKVSRNPMIPSRQGRLVMVGGSFLFSLTRIWEQSEVWREIEHFNYSFRLIHYPGGFATPLDLATVDWVQTIGNADAAVVEMNEELIGPVYLTRFIAAAIGGLPETPPPMMAAFPESQWYDSESDSIHHWHWSKGDADLLLHRTLDAPFRLKAAVKASRLSGTLRILGPDGSVIWKGLVGSDRLTSVRTEAFWLKESRGTLRLESDVIPGKPSFNGDPRLLGFGLWDLSFEEDEAKP